MLVFSSIIMQKIGKSSGASMFKKLNGTWHRFLKDIILEVKLTKKKFRDMTPVVFS